MSQPWYDYPEDFPGGRYGENKDALGDYLKPDTIFFVPAGLPITALTSGIVTDVSDRGYTAGGLSVTVKMDIPLNAVATHTSYNYLGSATVKVGDHVFPGQQIGTAGSKYGDWTSVGLTPDAYWGGPSFLQLQAVGDTRVNPEYLVNPIRSGKSPYVATSLTSQAESSPTQIVQDFWNFVFNAGAAETTVGQVANASDTVATALANTAAWLTNPIRVLKMAVGVALLLLSLYLLASTSGNPVSRFAGKYGLKV